MDYGLTYAREIAEEYAEEEAYLAERVRAAVVDAADRLMGELDVAFANGVDLGFDPEDLALALADVLPVDGVIVAAFKRRAKMRIDSMVVEARV